MTALDDFYTNTYGPTGLNILKHYYPLSESVGSTTAVDSVGGQNGTNTGVVAGTANILPTSDGSTCYLFAASAGINLGSPFANGSSSQWCFECWVNFTNVTTLFQALMQNGVDAHGFVVWLNTGPELAIAIDNTSNFAGGSIASGVARHIVAGYDGTNVRLYVNGVSQLNQARTGGTAPTTTNYIGRWSNVADGGSFLGKMQKVCYYNQMLTSTQVTNNYNAGNSGPPATNTTILAGTGTFSLLGKNATIVVNTGIIAATGIFNLSGNNANLTINTTIQAGTGTFNLSGKAATIAQGVQSGTGVFTLSGKNATLTVNTGILGATGVFTLTGNSAQINFTGIAPVTSQGTMEAGNGVVSNLLPGDSETIMGPINTPVNKSMKEVVFVQGTGTYNLDYMFTTDRGTSWFIGKQVASQVVSTDGTTTVNQAHIKINPGVSWMVQVTNTSVGSINITFEKRLVRRGKWGV